MNEQLQVLFPTGKQITIKGEQIVVTPFKLGELQSVFRAIEPIYGTIIDLMNATSDRAHLFTALMSKQGDSFIELAAVGVRKPKEWVADLGIDEAIDAILTVLEVNVDFFVQKVLPGLNERVEKLVAAQLGQTK